MRTGLSEEPLILAVESSCDDSSVAYIGVESGVVHGERTLNLAHYHKQYGGVVPEIAGREHLRAFADILGDGLEPQNLRGRIAAVAATVSPGLIGSLLVGVSYAKALAWVLDKPLIPVDHIEGHIFSPFIGTSEVPEPFACFVVSGGHTLIALAEGAGDFKLLGRTGDDAIGEAFDKTAKILGLEYPGGPAIDQLCQRIEAPAHQFTMPLKGQRTLNFSLSGLKTAVLYASMDKGLHNPDRPLMDLETYIRETPAHLLQEAAGIARGFQQTIAAIVCQRIRDVYALTGCSRFCLSGGVSANSSLREATESLAAELEITLFCPELKYCGDNAAMIGYAARLHWLKDSGKFSLSLGLTPNPLGIFSHMTPQFDKY